MSSPIDAAFGKLAKMPYRLSLHYANGICLANGQLTLQRDQTFKAKGKVALGKIVRYYADDTDFDVYRSSGGTVDQYKVEIVVRRTIPRYYIALLLGGKTWYDWSADSNPDDDVFYGGSFASLTGTVGTWGHAVLSLTLK
jgi:hypothetical protein